MYDRMLLKSRNLYAEKYCENPGKNSRTTTYLSTKIEDKNIAENPSTSNRQNGS